MKRYIVATRINPEKIREWRVRLAKRAWLPHLSVGIDRDADTVEFDS
jgi:hypothetical protein